MSTRPLLALDFDGVVSDSAPECFWVARMTEAELAGASPAALGLPPPPDALRTDPRFAAFLALMPLGNRAEDFAVALRILAEGAPVADQAAYDAYRAACDPDWLARFHTAFYARRAALARAHPEAWHALMRAYPGVPGALRRLAGRFELAIATSKDRATVGALLAAYGIGDLFRDARLLDKEAGRAKTAHLRALCERTGTPPTATLFVDDKVNHLERVADLGVRCALAGWGYNGERERARARALGFAVLEPERWEAQLEALGDGVGAP